MSVPRYRTHIATALGSYVGCSILCLNGGFHDAEGETLDDMVTVEDLVFYAPDFETFVYRFWIENTILYALGEEHPLTREQQVYLDAVQRARTLPGRVPGLRTNNLLIRLPAQQS